MNDDLAELYRNGSPAFQRANRHLLAPEATPVAAPAPAPSPPIHVVTKGERRLEAIAEAIVIKLAKAHGWYRYHTHDARRSEAGFPDEMLLRPPRLVVAELKKDGRIQPTAAQTLVLDLFASYGAPVETYLWRPEHELEIEQILRGDPEPPEGWTTRWH